MPSQAPTPRTTRNSRGLRQSPGVSSADSCLGDSARVSRRRRSSGTPSTTNFVLALETAAQPATPTPRARFAQPTPHPAHTLALEAIPEEQPQPATPTPTFRPAVARPPVFPPPVSLPPVTPYAPTPPPRTSSPLEHPRVTAIRSTPASARRPASPRTPVRHTRYVTRYIDVTPGSSPAPTPKSPGSETLRFRQRRDQEGEEKFARELWIAIRNDKYMKGCWCGPPSIYNSKEEAEVATGHLRFYVVSSGRKKNLRVLQRKDDFQWHCFCGNNNYHAVYKNLLNANGKRPAEDTEIDLIAQNQEPSSEKNSHSVDRVVPAPIDPALGEEEQSQTPQVAQAAAPAPAPSMWVQVCSIFNRAVATMSSSLVTLYDTLREEFRGDAYEALDTRRKDADTGAIIVKRLKRQGPATPTEQSPSDNEDDGFDNLFWAVDPTKRIGSKNIQAIREAFELQYRVLVEGRVFYSSTMADLRMHAHNDRVYETSVCVLKYKEHMYGPTLPGESDDEKTEKWQTAARAYRDRLKTGIESLERIYDRDKFQDLKREYPAPPRRLLLKSTIFRQEGSFLGHLLGFLRSLDSEHTMPIALREAISQMIVDANAVHKGEMLPSYVEHDPMKNMPGRFPEDKDKVSAIEEVAADDYEIKLLYDYKFPDPEPSDREEPVRVGDYRLVAKPTGILKPPKVRDEAPASPKYVATPDRDRKLSFINPVSKFVPPTHIPTKLVAPQAPEAEPFFRAKLKAEVIRDEHSTRMFDTLRTVSEKHNGTLLNLGEDPWSLEGLERDDREMGLTYHAQKYDGFLNDIHDDLGKRAQKEEERAKPPIRAPRRRMVQIPLPPLPSTPVLRQRAAYIREINARSPGTPSSPGPNPLSRPRAEDQPPKPDEKKRAPKSLDDFFAEDDDDLAISVLKLEQLQIDRQIRDEFESGVQRAIAEKRRREEEEALLAEERRLEEKLRQREEERRRQEAARRQKEVEEFAALTGLRPPTRRLITSLSDDWHARVTNAARANPSAELVKTLEGQPLTRRDFEEKLLPATAWLNDNVIIGSILHIADYINKAQGATDQEPKCAAFTSYFWPRVLSHGPGACGRLLRRAGVRKANLLDIDTILIPICSQSHWTLAVIRPGKRTVAHIDSMRGGNGHEDVKAKLLELVRHILEDQFVEADWRAVDYPAPRQTNGWDCGVFTITNAICMAVGLNPKLAYHERELTLQRRRLAAMLLNEGFKGEFSLDGL